MTSPILEGAAPYRVAIDTLPPPAPFDARELRGALLHPQRALELLLVERERLAKTVASGERLPALVGLLLLASVLFALPYGVVLDGSRGWRVAVLYLGAVAIAFPSLHVFSNYLGFRLRLSQNLGIALTGSAVASTFLLGFAPIAWFVAATTSSSSVAPRTVSASLLAAALLAGLGHIGRTFFSGSLVLGTGHKLLVFVWQLLVLLIAVRLADALGLT